MIEHAAILAVLLAKQAFSTDHESNPEREARLSPVAAAIAEASEIRPDGVPRITMIAVLIDLGYWETKFARYVGEGRCKDGPPGARCDPGPDGEPRARTYWQVWHDSCPSAWNATPGSPEEMRAGAMCAAKIFTTAYKQCRAEGFEGAFSRYTSRSCEWKGAPERLKAMFDIREELWRVQRKIAAR